MMAARKKLDFQYPFPTLKQRAILTVCRHWIDNTLVPQFCDGSSGLACLECEVSVCNLMPDAINKFVDNLAVPKALKVDFYHVLNGLHHQLSYPFEVFFCCSNHKLGVYIDNSGRFDHMDFLRCCIKKNLDKDLHILYALFSVACKKCLFPEIDLVFKKIVTAVDGGERDSEMLLEQPTHQSVRRNYVITYRFLHEADASMVDRLNAMSSYMGYSSCHANQERIMITLDPTNFTIDALKQHITLVEPSLRDDFVRNLIVQGKHFFFSTVYLLEILEYLDQESTRDWPSHFEEGENSIFPTYCYCLLMGLLDWPFNQFFVPTLNLLSSHLRDENYCHLFIHVVSCIEKEQPKHATLYRGLLHSLFSAMPLRLKQECLNWQRGKNDEKEQLLCDMKIRSCSKECFLKAMIRLKIKAPSLYNELVTEQ